MRRLLIGVAWALAGCGSGEHGNEGRCSELDSEAHALVRKAEGKNRCASDDDCTERDAVHGCDRGCRVAIAKQDVPALEAAEEAAAKGPCAERRRRECRSVLPEPSCEPGFPTCVGSACVLRMRPAPAGR